MSAIVSLTIATGVGETLHEGELAINYQNDDAVTDPASSPISIPAAPALAYSYEKYAKLKFDGTFTAITNVKIWKSQGVLPDGVNIKGDAVEEAAYVQPVTTASSIALNDVPENDTDAVSLQPAAGITVTGSYSKYLVSQAVISGGATAQTLATQTYRWRYDET